MSKDPIEYFFENAFPLLVEEAPKWGWPANIAQNNVKPTYLNALSNMTYKVEYTGDDHQLEPILFKMFGTGLIEQLLDRDIDNKISKLIGDSKIGPTVLYFSDKIRVENFIIAEGFTAEDMNDPIQRRKLMFFISRIHRIDADFLDKDTLFTRMQNDSFPMISLFKSSVESKSELFTPEEQDKINKIRQLISQEEIDFLMSNISEDSDVVLSHNDFLNGNILKRTKDDFVLIDFEYSTKNLRSFDIANFINESLFDYDYPEHPYFEYSGEKRGTEESFSDIVKYYLLFSKQESDMELAQAIALCNDQDQVETLLLEMFGSQESLDTAVQKMLQEIRIGTLISHYTWILWGIMMCKNPSIKFGYIEFSYQRFEDYLAYKEKYF